MTYYTDYSIEDCIGLLSRKNIYDVFEYSFEMKTENAGEIAFVGSMKHLWGGPKAVYTIELKKNKKTIIDIKVRENRFFITISIVPQKYITEFMKQKLDAVERGRFLKKCDTYVSPHQWYSTLYIGADVKENIFIGQITLIRRTVMLYGLPCLEVQLCPLKC